MFNIAVCDTNIEIHNLLKSYFLRFSVAKRFVFKIEYFFSGEELLEHYRSAKKHLFHAIFLEIELSGIDGLETAREIRSFPDHDVQIIFITHHEKYMLNCFDVQAFQYMLKPICYDLFQEKLLMLCHYIPSLVHHFLSVKVNNEQLILRTSDIVSLVKIKHALCQNKVEISLIQKNEPIVVSGTLQGYTEKLDPTLFLLIHRSVIVNLNYVQAFTSESVIMSNQVQFPIGRSHSKKFRELYC
ncbi:response regulator transcription factor [Paenibacillus albidus]|uniref:LytR/AlgR family response regulator transcription factor n=1 Tax=Paenibacillus albidus TaxID=2041023 RepID=UPI001BE5587A|nr:LytTR family DNA-binding domain-containing protein [Paenibacillus albidus]MBT2291986.1 response regulator transcription factor [Paenibacillus albidus]